MRTKPKDMVRTHLEASQIAAKDILKSKAKATAFLVSAGILEKNGKRLAKPYR
jgi:hypothetical protein